MDTQNFSVADESVSQRVYGITPPLKVAFFLALFIYFLTKDVKMVGLIISAHMILHGIFK
jgi:hypothetical protein